MSSVELPRELIRVPLAVPRYCGAPLDRPLARCLQLSLDRNQTPAGRAAVLSGSLGHLIRHLIAVDPDMCWNPPYGDRDAFPCERRHHSYDVAQDPLSRLACWPPRRVGSHCAPAHNPYGFSHLGYPGNGLFPKKMLKWVKHT